MYLEQTKAMLTIAMRNTFDADYVNPHFRSLPISIEYPEKRQDYPGIWVDFEPVGDLEIVGINHAEYVVQSGGTARRHTRWRFQGYATYTVVAMSSRERDSLYDEVVRIFAFGAEHATTKAYREAIEDNTLIAMNMDFGTISPRGFAASPGTPWGTEEIIYEATVAMDVIGEFVADTFTGTLAPITSISVTDRTTTEVDPTNW